MDTQTLDYRITRAQMANAKHAPRDYADEPIDPALAEKRQKRFNFWLGFALAGGSAAMVKILFNVFAG